MLVSDVRIKRYYPRFLLVSRIPLNMTDSSSEPLFGENHVSGIAARLQARGVEPECRWLATEADVATPADT